MFFIESTTGVSLAERHSDLATNVPTTVLIAVLSVTLVVIFVIGVIVGLLWKKLKRSVCVG